MTEHARHDDSIVDEHPAGESDEAAAIRVLLVDDQALIRTGFSLILSATGGQGSQSEPPIEVVGEAGDGAEALRVMRQLADEHRTPDVVLMDVRMPNMDGIEATTHIVREFPNSRVLVLTTFDLDEYALAAIEAGAGGFLLKDARATELVAAVRSVAEGDAVMAASLTRRLISRLREGTAPSGATEGSTSHAQQRVRDAGEAAAVLEQLTDREREVFALIAEGLTNAEIGERLYLSESTVKTHVGRVFAKLDLRDRVHAVILAYEAGVR